MKLKYLNIPLNIKSVDEKGAFTGYGSVFHTVDSYMERVLPGAFADSLADHQKRGTMPAMLWQHDSWEPIGIYKAAYEDKKGLYLEGQLAVDSSVPNADKAHSLMTMGAMRGLSIGYNVIEAEENEDDRVNELKKVDLWEISLVTFPANPDAQIDAVRAKISGDKPLMQKEIELILRDAGFSRRSAKGLLSRGYSGYQVRDAPEDLQPLIESFRHINAALIK